jgi:hypothetical protein
VPAPRSGSYSEVVINMVLIMTATVVFSGLLVVLFKLTRHFSSPQQIPVTVEWINELSLDRYRPMLHLLNQKELRYMRTQPGFTPKMETKLRIERGQSFRRHLHNLDDDFERICSAVKVLLAQSKHDRPDLALALVQSQMKFSYCMMVMQWQLVCYRYSARTVDATALMALFDGMRIELRSLVAVGLGVGA